MFEVLHTKIHARYASNNLVPIHKWLFCPISSLCSNRGPARRVGSPSEARTNFNPRNTAIYSCG